MHNYTMVSSKNFVLWFLMILLFVAVSYSQQRDETIFTYFLKPRPIDKTMETKPPSWGLKPTVHIPAVKLTESVRAEAEIDATFLASAGGGITLQRTIQDAGKNYSQFGVSLILLLTGDTSKKESVLDFSTALTISFFNNIVEFGFGRDFGAVGNRSRWFGLLSAGINLTNN